MTNPLRSDASHCFGLLLARVPIGLFFCLAGIGKIRGGIDEFANKMIGSVPPWMPPPWGSYYLHALPFVEIAVGAMAVLGLLGRFSGLVMSLMLISFMIAMGTKPNPPGIPFNYNFVFLGVTLMLLFTGPGHISLDGAIWGRRGKKLPPTD